MGDGRVDHTRAQWPFLIGATLVIAITTTVIIVVLRDDGSQHATQARLDAELPEFLPKVTRGLELHGSVSETPRLRAPVLAVRMDWGIEIPRVDVDLNPRLDAAGLTTTELADVATFVIVYPSHQRSMRDHDSLTLVFVDVASKRVLSRKHFDGSALGDERLVVSDLRGRDLTIATTGSLYWQSIADHVAKHVER
ncbi:MAG: hypothetical protein ABI867_40450 [Kofleriaceae bacterium]